MTRLKAWLVTGPLGRGVAFGIDFAFVAEGDGVERKDSFACLVHRLDLLFKTFRGEIDGTELSVVSD